SATDLQMNPINGTIVGASSIVVEGYAIFNATDGSIDNQEANVLANGNAFGGNAAAIQTRLLANNGGLASVVHIQPGAEIINLAGDLTLANNWDLSTYRFGQSGEPGALTLRAAGNLIFEFGASLSDGFDPSGGSFGLWDAPLLAPGSRSWSYQLTAGSDFQAASPQTVMPLALLAPDSGSVLIGDGSPPLPTTATDRFSVIFDQGFYQTIRTGTGDITIAAGRDVQLLNPLVTIYTAGSQAAPLAGFDLPQLDYNSSILGDPQFPIYNAQYSLGGGNVTISAQNDITHLVLIITPTGNELVPDSSKELPINWLYRRGAIDPLTGNFAINSNGADVQSTT